MPKLLLGLKLLSVIGILGIGFEIYMFSEVTIELYLKFGQFGFYEGAGFCVVFVWMAFVVYLSKASPKVHYVISFSFGVASFILQILCFMSHMIPSNLYIFSLLSSISAFLSIFFTLKQPKIQE